jgi:hypothetical protein
MPQFLLQTMRGFTETEGEAASCVFAGGMDPDDEFKILTIPVEEHPRVTLTLVEASLRASTKLQRPSWVCVVADTYYLLSDDQDEPLPVHGELERRFKAGDTKVVEALMCTFLTEEGDLHVFNQPYLRTSTSSIVWDEVTEMDDDFMDGVLLDMMRQIIGGRHAGS